MAKRTTPKTDQETTTAPERRRATSVNQSDKPTAAKASRRRKGDEPAAESVSSVSDSVAASEGPAAIADAAQPSAGASFVKVQDVVEIELSHDEIAERAYHIYLERGAQPGDPFADWLTAERQLRERLVVDVPERLPARANPDALAQVLGNLISNAARYTPAGGTVTVRAERRSSDLLVSIANTGDGIPPDDLPRVFERFYRVEKSRDPARGGAGIGLAIVKQLVEAHGGQVWATSAPGQGATFVFTLPIATSENQT